MHFNGNFEKIMRFFPFFLCFQQTFIDLGHAHLNFEEIDGGGAEIDVFDLDK